MQFHEFKSKFPRLAKVWEMICENGTEKPEDFNYEIGESFQAAEEFAAGQEDLSPWAEDEMDDVLGRAIMSLGMGLATIK